MPVDAKRISGTLAISTGTAMELQDPAMEGLARIEVREIPDGLQSLSTDSLIAGFRYLQAPVRLTARFYRPEELPVLVAIAEQAELATVMTPSGDAITRAGGDFSGGDRLRAAREAGLLPFRIAVPRSGRAHSFGRLLLDQETPVIRVTYLRGPISPFSACVLLLSFSGIGLALRRLRPA